MADDTSPSFPSRRAEGSGRGPRQGDSRDGGGFRIRLSDNEMQAARALQEAFQLRSTVAVLGFALRTLATQLEAGQLDELIAQQRAQGPGPGRSSEGRGGERRGGPRDGQRGGGGESRSPRANPFARPSRPAAAAAEAAPEPDGTPATEADAEGEGALDAELDLAIASSAEPAAELAPESAIEPAAEPAAEASAEP